MITSQNHGRALTQKAPNCGVYRPNFPVALHTGSICIPKHEERGLCTLSMWTRASTLVTGSQLSFGYTQCGGQLFRHRIGKRNFSTLDTANHLGGRTSCGTQLRLSEPSQDAPVSRKPLGNRHLNEVGNLYTEHFHDTRQKIHLGRCFLPLPSSDRRPADISLTSEFGPRNTHRSPRSSKVSGAKSPHDSSAHGQRPTHLVLISRHFAASLLGYAHKTCFIWFALEGTFRRKETTVSELPRR
jgi:hypothetical protein